MLRTDSLAVATQFSVTLLDWSNTVQCYRHLDWSNTVQCYKLLDWSNTVQCYKLLDWSNTVQCYTPWLEQHSSVLQTRSMTEATQFNATDRNLDWSNTVQCYNILDWSNTVQCYRHTPWLKQHSSVLQTYSLTEATQFSATDILLNWSNNTACCTSAGWSHPWVGSQSLPSMTAVNELCLAWSLPRPPCSKWAMPSMESFTTTDHRAVNELCLAWSVPSCVSRCGRRLVQTTSTTGAFVFFSAGTVFSKLSVM